MNVPIGKLVVIFITLQVGLSNCDATDFSLDEFLQFVQLAQAEITSGQLEIIYRIDTLPTKSEEEAHAEAEIIIRELEANFSARSVEVQEHPLHRQIHETNIRLGGKYLPQVMAGERHEIEKWNLCFEAIYYSASSKEPVFAHRFTKKNIKEYVDPDEAAFYHAGQTLTAIFDGERTIIFAEVSPNRIYNPEQSLGPPGEFNYEIRQLIGRCLETTLRKEDIHFFAPMRGKKSEYVLAFRVGENEETLTRVVIDVDKGFRIRRIEYFAPPTAAQPYSAVEFLEYQSTSGVLHPRKIKRFGYETKGDSRQITSREEWEIKVAKFHSRFPDDYYQISEELRDSLR